MVTFKQEQVTLHRSGEILTEPTHIVIVALYMAVQFISLQATGNSNGTGISSLNRTTTLLLRNHLDLLYILDLCD